VSKTVTAALTGSLAVSLAVICSSTRQARQQA